MKLLDIRHDPAFSDYFKTHTTLRYIVFVVLLACTGIFVLRAPVRAGDPSINMDAPLLLAAAAAWRDGDNPYYTEAVAAHFAGEKSLIDSTLERGRQAFVYSPSVYALLVPLTYLPWTTQRWVWNCVNTSLLVCALGLVCGIFRVSLPSPQACAILGIGLASNPGQICIALGQTGVMVLFLMCVSWRLLPGDGSRPQGTASFLGASLALGLATLLKPQIALIYMLLNVYRGRWRLAVAAAVVAAGILYATLAIHGDMLGVLHAWLENMQALLHADADPFASPLPHQLINLESPIAVLTGNRVTTHGIAIGVCVMLLITYAGAERRSRRSADERISTWLNSLSAATLMVLLAFYHRIYDAVFLVIPLAFAVRLIAEDDRLGWSLLLVLTPLCIPLTSIVYHLLNPPGGRFDASPVVQVFVIQHQTWCLVAAFLLLCLSRHRSFSPPDERRSLQPATA